MSSFIIFALKILYIGIYFRLRCIQKNCIYSCVTSPEGLRVLIENNPQSYNTRTYVTSPEGLRVHYFFFMMYVVDVLEVGKCSHHPLFSLPSTTYNYLIYNGAFAISGLIHPHLMIPHSLCNLYIAPFCTATHFSREVARSTALTFGTEARLASTRCLHLEFDSTQSR